MHLPATILFVGAHCDDIELFAGGLLSLACRRVERVGVLVFSDHRGIVSDADADRARAEFRENLEELRGSARAEVVDHSARMLRACRGDFQQERELLYRSLEALRGQYSLVVSHSHHDTNQDHQQVAAEVARVFKAHATVLGGEFPNNDLGRFSPQVYVSLDEADIAAKIAMVQRYRSQQFNERPYFGPESIRGLAAVRGSQIRAQAAEAFEVSARILITEPA